MKYKILPILGITVCLLSGCWRLPGEEIKATPSDGKQGKEQTAPAVLGDVPEVYRKESGCVVFDASVNLNGYQEKNGLVEGTATVQKADGEKAFDILWTERDGECVWDSLEVPNEYGEKVVYKGCMNPTYTASFESGGVSSWVSYSANDGRRCYYDGSFHFEHGYDDYNADKYSLTDQLAFMTREDAFSLLDKTLKDIGLAFECEYNAYALDAPTLEAEEYHMGMDGNDDLAAYKDRWTQEDEAYFFALRQTYGDIPILYAFGRQFAFYVDDIFRPVQAYVTKDGVVDLTTDWIFDITPSGTVQELVGFQEAADAVEAKYNNVLTDETYTISRIDLVYVIDVNKGKGEFGMVPAWVFCGTKKNGRTVQTIIDARNGREILLEKD